MKRKSRKTDSVLNPEERAAILKMLDEMPLEGVAKSKKHTQTYPRGIEPIKRPTKPMFRR